MSTQGSGSFARTGNLESDCRSMERRSVAAASLASRHVDSNSKSRNSVFQELDLKQFGFHAQTAFDADKELEKFRSKNFRLAPLPLDNNVWRRPPPDFRPQAWEPKPPKRNSRDAMQPWKYRIASDAEFEATVEARKNHVSMPTAMSLPGKKNEKSGMRLRFRPLRAGSARMRSVRDAALQAGPYHNPQPHDHRALPLIQSLGLDEFETNHDKDPYNIRFLTKHKNTIIGPLNKNINLRNCSGTMWSAVCQPEKWENSLHLPREKWPSRPKEYTRYRLPFRDPHDAFLGNVELKLNNQWSTEQISR